MYFLNKNLVHKEEFGRNIKYFAINVEELNQFTFICEYCLNDTKKI